MTDLTVNKTPAKNDLIQRLNEHRISQGLTYEKLARLLNVSVISISNWLKNKSNPNTLLTHRIEKYLATVTRAKTVICVIEDAGKGNGNGVLLKDAQQYASRQGYDVVLSLVLLSSEFLNSTETQEKFVKRISRTLKKFPEIKDIIFFSNCLTLLPASIQNALSRTCYLNVVGKDF